LAVQKKDGRVVYFNGSMAVFNHPESDIRTFRMITSQFCCEGIVKQETIARVFKIPKITVKRAVKLYRDTGAQGFYEKRKTRGPAVLTADVINTAQSLLDEGGEVAGVADELGIKRNTMVKAVAAGRLHVVKKNSEGKIKPLR
jgi:DNA invertase Pin-like site-specific DNA recombinase